jgi:hypothetical protein
MKLGRCGTFAKWRFPGCRTAGLAKDCEGLAIRIPGAAPGTRKNNYAWLAASLPSAACAAAKRAIGTRNGEHDT